MVERTARYIFSIAPLVLFSSPLQAEIERIQVTAQKRLEEQHTVAVTMQAYTKDSMTKLDIQKADDVLDHLANIGRNATSDVNTGFTIRGVGTNNYHGNVTRAVGIYMDEVSTSTTYSGVAGVFDLERIEVLRGPQNTLFGRNSMGGAIHYISAKPTVGGGEHGYFKGTIGEYNRQDIEAAAGFDLSERWAARVAFMSQQKDGLFTNLAPGYEDQKLGETDRFGWRAQLLYEVSPDGELLFNWHQGKSGGTGNGAKAVGLRDGDNASLPCSVSRIVAGADFETVVNCVTPTGFNPSSSDWHTLYDISSKIKDVEQRGGYVRYVHSFEGMDLTWISATESTDVLFSEDLGGEITMRFMAYQDSSFDQVSHEARLTSTTDSAFSWMAGLFYFDEETRQNTNVRRDFGTDPNNPIDRTLYNILNQDDKELSAYAKFDYDLTERNSLSLGLRYIRSEKTANSYYAVISIPQSVYPATLFFTQGFVTAQTIDADEPCQGATPPCSLNFPGLEQKQNELVYDIKYRYQFNPDAYGYASYSTGFKSGGFDSRAQAALAGDPTKPVEPEEMEAIELGYKSWWNQDTLQFNAAAFYYLWQDLQTFDVVDGIPGFVNIPEVELWGMEVELNWQFLENSTVYFNAGLLQSEITDIGSLTSVDEGHDLQNTPPVTANLRLEQQVPSAYGLWTLMLESQYIAKQYDSLNDTTDKFTKKPEQLYLNANASLDLTEQFELSFWVQNITEEKTCLQMDTLDNPEPNPESVTAFSGILMCNPSEGARQAGVTLTKSW